MSSRVKKNKKQGTKSDSSHNQTFQNRVKDVFRKGIQWKWDRETDPTSTLVKEHETPASSSQRRWPYFAPIAVQKFRRLFSSDGTENVVTEGCTVIGPVSSSSNLISSHAITESEVDLGNATDMVRMKSQVKGSGEPFSVHTLQDTVSLLPAVSVGNFSVVESINVSEAKQDQDCAPKTIPASVSEMEVSLFGDTSDNLKSESSESHNLIEATKARDKDDKSADSDCISDNQPNACDEKREIFKETPGSISHEKQALKSFDRTLELTIRKNSTHSRNSSDASALIDCIEANICEMNNSSAKVEKSGMIVSCRDETTNAPFVSSALDTTKTPNQQSKKALEPLYLSLDSSFGVGTTLTRKSPVTVQEWVDSIPLSSHLENDPENESSVQELSEASVEQQDFGDVCPSVTIRPAPNQSGTAADQRREAFSRDASPSLQSDTGSHGSSVDSYLEARRPDPEEVLLGLGFGGPIHNAEAEVSRIPSRFLQPSKVKGVAIDDFLRYQQELIETFESGHSGYRGLTGGAQVPSIIVAKIMEKLREHERESSTKSSAGSSPGHHPDISKRRFSRAAHRVTILTKMKSRESIGCGAQAHSVLNPDNRKFLDNQGSKSPEVSRKRMIIGHRSFTFDGEGQLIEADTNTEEVVPPEITAPSKPPLPRPLVHKDSVTSLSLTSYDSDSDTDDASAGDISNNANRQRLQRYLSSPLGVSTSTNLMLLDSVYERGLGLNASGKRRRSLPSPLDLLNNLTSSGGTNLAECDENDLSVYGKNNGQVCKTSTPDRGSSWRDLHRVNSVPIISPISLPTILSILGTHREEIYSASGELDERNRSSPEMKKLALPQDEATAGNSVGMLPSAKHELSSYKITDFVLPGSPPSSNHPCGFQSFTPGEDPDDLRHYSLPKSSAMFLDKETRRLLSLNSSDDSCNAGSVVHSPDSKHWSLSSVSSWESEKTHFHKNEAGEHLAAFEVPQTSVAAPETDANAANNRRRGSLKRQQKFDEEDSSVVPQFNLKVNLSNKPADQGDSFEMEELVVEEEVRCTRTGSAHSDSSGFQEEHNQIKELPLRAVLGKQLSESEPLLYTRMFPDEPVATAEHLKRLSLPVIRVQDESGLTQWQACSFARESAPFSSCLRRVRSMPSQISRLGVERLCENISPGSTSDSIGNMFSSCSDESVIHLPRPTSDTTSELDQPELLALHTSISGNGGESEARRASQECCNCNSTLRKSLAKCHNDLSISQESVESFLNISRDLQNLKEAHDQIKKALLQVQNNLCSSDCSMKTALKQVSHVIQQQTSFSVQLERLNLDLLSSIGIVSVKNLSVSPSSSLEHKSGKDDSLKKDDDNHQHSFENCSRLCKVVERENQRLQELVRLNVNELAQVRALLEKILPIVKD